MNTHDMTTAPVDLDAPTSSGSRCNPTTSNSEIGTTNIMTQPTDPKVNVHARHATWCNLRDEDEDSLHGDVEPYCSQVVTGIKLIPQGDTVKSSAWISPTRAFNHGRFTHAEIFDREEAYNGVEIAVEGWAGPGTEWSDQRIRMTSDAARSLAAALIRAADIEQGLTQ